MSPFGRVAAEVRRVMREKGLDRHALAERMDVTPWRVTQLTQGEHNPTIRTLVAVAEATGTTLRVRLESVDSPPGRLDDTVPGLTVPDAPTPPGRPEGRTGPSRYLLEGLADARDRYRAASAAVAGVEPGPEQLVAVLAARTDYNQWREELVQVFLGE